jgi:hypothetical protein
MENTWRIFQVFRRQLASDGGIIFRQHGLLKKKQQSSAKKLIASCIMLSFTPIIRVRFDKTCAFIANVRSIYLREYMPSDNRTTILVEVQRTVDSYDDMVFQQSYYGLFRNIALTHHKNAC